MLQSSISTILMAVITTNIFLALLTLFFCDANLMVRAGYKLLALLAAFSILRFVLPIELPFTITIPLPPLVSDVIVLIYGELFTFRGQFVSLWMLFKLVWALGFILGLVRYVLSYLRARRYIVLFGKAIGHKEPYRALLDQICGERGRRNRFTVLEMPGLHSPVLFGFLSPKILLPEGLALPERQLYYVLHHEASHHFHHDLWLKNAIKLISLVYWWDPFCILLNKQADTILEMRIDDSLTRSDSVRTGEYMNCLIDMSENALRRAPLPKTFTMSLLPAGRSPLKNRFLMLTDNQGKPHPALHAAILLFTVSVYLLSYAFVPEACVSMEHFASVHVGDNSIPFPVGNGYAVHKGDGTYDIYFLNTYVETVDSLAYYPKDIPVYTEENRSD